MQGEEVVDGSSHVGVQLPRRFLVNVAKNLSTFSEILKTMRLPFYLASFEEAGLVSVEEYKKGEPEKAREMLTETLLDIGVDEVMHAFLPAILCYAANLMRDWYDELCIPTCRLSDEFACSEENHSNI